jgi:hypothetical protein
LNTIPEPEFPTSGLPAIRPESIASAEVNKVFKRNCSKKKKQLMIIIRGNGRNYVMRVFMSIKA